jgi:uncharacterized protein with HEPN domain
MSKHDDRVYLQHILDSIGHVQNFTQGVIDRFHEMPEKWFATIRALQILSESCTKLSEQTQRNMPDVQWQRIRGFRNILVHDYLGDIDPLIVRKVIEIELPKLQKEAQRMLLELGEKNV